MTYGIALCTSDVTGLYSWSLLDGQTFQSQDEAIEYARQYVEDSNWNGVVTFADAYSWNFRRQENSGEMDDLCLVSGKDFHDIIGEINRMG